MKKILIFLLLITKLSIFAQPANDNCAGAVIAPQDGSCITGTNVTATDGWAGCVGCQAGACNNHRDVWYTFTATGTFFQYNITAGTLTGNVEIILVTAPTPCTSPFTLLASNCGPMPLLGSFTGLTIGTTYYFTISAPGNTQGTFNVCTTVSTPAPASGQDCSSATQICSSSNVNGNSSGFATQELNASNRGCLSGNEHNSSWYVLSIGTSGTLSMTITPSNGSDDYDFAIWGPSSACPPSAPPIRCSWVAYPRAFGCGTNTNPTGMSLTGTVTSTGACPDVPFIQYMNVLAGETYLLLIDAYTSSPSPFDLTWGGTSILDCSPLPIELTDFHCETKTNNITIYWTTATETNNDYFELWRSSDAVNFIKILTKDGAGTSTSPINYWHQDYFPPTGTYYYRLKQVDFNGVETISEITSCNYVQDAGVVITYFNTIGQEININTAVPGLYIKQYSKDGNVRREVYYKTQN